MLRISSEGARFSYSGAGVAVDRAAKGRLRRSKARKLRNFLQNSFQTGESVSFCTAEKPRPCCSAKRSSSSIQVFPGPEERQYTAAAMEFPGRRLRSWVRGMHVILEQKTHDGNQHLHWT